MSVSVGKKNYVDARCNPEYNQYQTNDKTFFLCRDFNTKLRLHLFMLCKS